VAISKLSFIFYYIFSWFQSVLLRCGSSTRYVSRNCSRLMNMIINWRLFVGTGRLQLRIIKRPNRQN